LGGFYNKKTPPSPKKKKKGSEQRGREGKVLEGERRKNGTLTIGEKDLLQKKKNGGKSRESRKEGFYTIKSKAKRWAKGQ